jgi:CubicO group peptidase (beta-lactamase class C family)
VPRNSVATRGAAVLTLMALLAACTNRAPLPSESGPTPLEPLQPAYPGVSWQREDPVEAGFEPAELERIAADAAAAGSNCLVVTRDGRLVGEWYWNGTAADTAQEVFSTTKSVTSTLVGIAEGDGRLDLDRPASAYIDEWAGTASEEVTVEDLLSNDSGRHWDPTTDYRDLIFARDRTAFAVGLAQDSSPGDVWVYNNSAIQTLDAVLERATGTDPATYARERLLTPIGTQHSELTHDRAGNTNMYFGMRSTCEDLARFGHLFLSNGMWDGRQVVPENWVEAATGRPSQQLNAAYGYLWWLNRRGPVLDASAAGTGQRGNEVQGGDAPDGRLVESAPEDMYWAIGLGGQIVQVDPGSDTVVVRLGPGRGNSDYGPADTAKVVTDALTER